MYTCDAIFHVWQTPAYHTLKERLSSVPTIFHSLERLEKYVCVV